jgi:hypothetical protein
VTNPRALAVLMNVLTTASDRSSSGLSFSGPSTCCPLCSSALAAFAITSLQAAPGVAAWASGAGPRIGLPRSVIALIHGLIGTIEEPTSVPTARPAYSVSSPRVDPPPMATNPVSTLLQRFACARPSQSRRPGHPALIWLQRSPPWLLTTAACSGLRSAHDCRPRRALLHLSYSWAPPVLRRRFRDTRPKPDIGAKIIIAAQQLPERFVRVHPIS